MFIGKLILVLISAIFLSSCNSGKTDEEMDELWSKAQTTGKIIERSGTKFNSGLNKERALRDAETRLQTGGGLLGKGGISFSGIINNDSGNNNSTTTIAMTVNPFLWRDHINIICQSIEVYRPVVKRYIIVFIKPSHSMFLPIFIIPFRKVFSCVGSPAFGSIFSGMYASQRVP